MIRRRFVEDSGLEYPIGTAAAETLMASRAGGKTGRKLFGSMALAGIWCALRDLAGAIPAMLCALPIPGVAFGIYNSPMLLSVGFLAVSYTHLDVYKRQALTCAYCMIALRAENRPRLSE